MKSDVAQLTTQAVSGLLWLYLDVPEDARRGEIEALAEKLVGQVRCNANPAFVEQQLRVMQVQTLCGLVNLRNMAELAARILVTVNGAPQPRNLRLVA